jgi:alkyl hydroperoxide reductase subunit AhpC
MPLRINDLAPDFVAETTHGQIGFHAWLGYSWGVLFSHPKDFTPICTTELAVIGRLAPEFARRDVKVIALSVDDLDLHQRWSKDIEETQGNAPAFPIIADTSLEISKLYDMLPASAEGESSGRTAADNQTVRNVYVIGPDKRIKLSLAYPMSTGRNFDEILLAIDALQVTANYQLHTPANWRPGDDCIIPPMVSNEDARMLYPGGWRQLRPYLRYVPQPHGRVHYSKHGIATFDVPVDTVFVYMCAGDHRHKAFKSHKLRAIDGDLVTVEVEIYNPDGTTSFSTLFHELSRPNGITSTMNGGTFDGAQFVHMYTSAGDHTIVDVAADFPRLPEMSEEQELEMIDGFFTTVFAEDAATLRTWKSAKQ